MSWADRSTGISPTITDSCSRTCLAGSTASDADIARIDEQIEARLAPFMWKTILDVWSSSPKTWAQRRHSWCSRRWSATPEGAQPADTRRGGEVWQPNM
jgi:hypothetical protein